MDRRRPRAYALIGITVSAAFMIGAPAYASEGSRLTMAAPPGFEDLAAERQLLLDVWFGGRKLGEARVRVAPGLLTFEDPAAVAALVPEVARPLELRQALEGALETNVSRL